MSRSRSIKVIVISALCLVSQFVPIVSVSASVDSNPWAVEDGLTFGEPERRDHRSGCSNRTVNVVGGRWPSRSKLCVYNHLSWRYAEDPTGLIVGVGADENMYRLSREHNLGIGDTIDVPYSNDLYFKNHENSARRGMSMIKDFPSKLRLTTSLDGAKVYELTDNSIQPFITSQSVFIRVVGVSDNGRWMVIADGGNGFVLRNMETGQLHWFSGHRFGTGMSSDASAVIANDGSVVAINDTRSGPLQRVYTLSASCGLIAQSYLGDILSELEQIGACPDDNGQVGRAAQLRFGSDWMHMKISRLSYDKSVLYLQGNFHVYEKYGENEYPLYTSALSPSSKLDYLALGDSYSSGEGDTIRLPWESIYRKGTDEAGPPMERCHISTRSYPYLFAKKYALQSTRWNSVACSGAQVREDYYGDDEDYLGQGERLSDIKDEDLLQSFKDYGRANFIPGRVKQLEFVKKYRPEVVTITGAGNDANFGGVLKTCVSPDDPENTCYYASGAHGKTMLGLGIKSQYGRIREVVRAIKDASPGTTVYYVGYPQFVSDRDVTCGGMVSLSLEERKVFRASTTYLNRVIKAAAESEGVNLPL